VHLPVQGVYLQLDLPILHHYPTLSLIWTTDLCYTLSELTTILHQHLALVLDTHLSVLFLWDRSHQVQNMVCTLKFNFPTRSGHGRLVMLSETPTISSTCFWSLTSWHLQHPYPGLVFLYVFFGHWLWTLTACVVSWTVVIDSLLSLKHGIQMWFIPHFLTFLAQVFLVYSFNRDYSGEIDDTDWYWITWCVLAYRYRLLQQSSTWYRWVSTLKKFNCVCVLHPPRQSWIRSSVDSTTVAWSVLFI
jgi:hypothetical protein